MPKSPEESSALNKDAESEPRYRPGEYRIEISVNKAREDIERIAPDIRVEQIKYLNEGLGSIAFLVNGDLIFRFAKNKKSDASIEKEVNVLPEIGKHLDVSIPNFEYSGKQSNGLHLVGYRKIEGEGLKRSDIVSSKSKVNEEIVQQIADFFGQLHSIDVAEAEQWGLREQNFHSRYKSELEDARDHIYSLLEQTFPDDAERIKDYIEKLFAGYLGDERNFEYKPAVLHGDLEAEHIIFKPDSRRINGIIDWGGVRIGDPDYDLFRPYSHYGRELVEELLKHYPHPKPELLFKKLDFFFRAQMIHRTVRSIMLGDKKSEWHLERLRKQALGIGYWYHELHRNGER